MLSGNKEELEGSTAADSDNTNHPPPAKLLQDWARTPLPHVCPYCGKTFTRRVFLRTHVYSHTGEKLFTCKVPIKIESRFVLSWVDNLIWGITFFDVNVIYVVRLTLTRWCNAFDVAKVWGRHSLNLKHHYIWQIFDRSCVSAQWKSVLKIVIWVAIYSFIYSVRRDTYNLCKYNYGTNPDYYCCEGVHKVLHQLPEPAAPQHEPHGQQALQLRCLWQELLAGSHPEETPTHSHINTASAQAWTQAGTVSTIFFLLKNNGYIKFSILTNICYVQMILRDFKPFIISKKVIFLIESLLWNPSYWPWVLCPSMQVCTLDNEGAAHLFPCPHCPSRFNTEDQLNHHK